MPAPRSLRFSLAPITTSITTAAPFQPSLLRKHTTPSSPLTPRLKSPAFRLSQATGGVATNSTHQQHSTSLSSTPNTSITISIPSPPHRPVSPLPWTWHCHLCHTRYRIGTTRRCLLDGHYFCSQPPPPSPPPSPSSVSARLVPPARLADRKAYCETKGEGKREISGKVGRRRKNRERRRENVTCTTAFDYLAWADWNAWRREMSAFVAGSLLSTAATTTAPETQDPLSSREILKSRKNCFTDCDFPSECQWRNSGAYLEAVREEQKDEDEEEESGSLI